MGRVIGIDLGTTFSCMAFMEGDEPKVIPNLDGMATTPSVLSFTSSGEELIGTLALRQSITNPEKTIYAIKRLMGKKYSSEEVRKTMKNLPYKLEEAENGDVSVQINSKLITPQEISAKILGYLKRCAESYFGGEVKEAVITVPAHFNDHQRQATKDAAKIAGLEVLRVINEPTAAILAYGLENKKNATVAVYDIGGGTFDITLMEINEGIFNVLATNGDSFLGGEDFDNRIVEWIINDFKEENGFDLSEDNLALQRIKEAAERSKKELSYTNESQINLPFIFSDKKSSKHIKKSLTRSKLEQLTTSLIERTFPYIDEVFDESKIAAQDVDQVIVVGGQSRMPMVNKMIEDYFRFDTAENINPDEIIAKGAALQSSILEGTMKDVVLLLDVTPLSLGIETENKSFTKIIEKNTTIPTKETMSFTTVEDNQSMVKVHVLQGESKTATDNVSLAVFDLVGIGPASAGVPQIDVTFEIDANGIVKVSAKDMSTGKKQSIKVKSSSGLTEDRINEIIKTSNKSDTQEEGNDET